MAVSTLQCRWLEVHLSLKKMMMKEVIILFLLISKEISCYKVQYVMKKVCFSYQYQIWLTNPTSFHFLYCFRQAKIKALDY